MSGTKETAGAQHQREQEGTTVAAKINKVGKVTRANLRKMIVARRDKKQMSWAQIGAEFNIAPRTARRLYDEAKGEGAHYGLLQGKGGRRPVDA